MCVRFVSHSIRHSLMQAIRIIIPRLVVADNSRLAKWSGCVDDSGAHI